MQPIRGASWRFYALACALVLAAPACVAQQLVVGAGARLVVGATLELGCADLRIDGTLDDTGTMRGAREVAIGGTASAPGELSLSGDFAAAGSFAPAGGTVRIVDGCARTLSRIVGANAFSNLLVTGSGRTLSLPAGRTQTIATSLAFQGGTQRLALRSDAPGRIAFLALASGGNQAFAGIVVRDVGAPANAADLAPGDPSAFDSVDNGNSPRFFAGSGGDVALPVPVSAPALLLLALSLVLVACAHAPRPAGVNRR
jgi:hypothetical protein